MPFSAVIIFLREKYKVKKMRSAFALVTAGLALVPGLLATPPPAQLPCSSLDASRIRLVTFDVFAALMDTLPSLKADLGSIAPFLTSAQVGVIIKNWVHDYGAVQGQAFTRAQTGGAEPFPFFFQRSLAASLASLGLTDRIPTGSTLFLDMYRSWGNLAPRPATLDALRAVAGSGRLVAALSNGDTDTLHRAMAPIAARGVAIQQPFSSDWPVGSFKPHGSMYDQIFANGTYAYDEVLHVAGAPTDAQGARRYGMFAGLSYNKPLQQDPPCAWFKTLADVVTFLNITTD
jgi:FMN phosphatase YigB (HAD superfamily)